MSLNVSFSVLALIGFIDAISNMAVAPSLIFYIRQVGGDKHMYGLAMSAFSFATFCCSPLYGIWVDSTENKFRIPYLTSFSIAITGALVYFFASTASNPEVALALILGGRLLSGLGAANQSLGYAYIASTVPEEHQTRTNTLLAMTRILGMAVGPGVNVLLDKIDGQLRLFDGRISITLDSLNSVGLLLATGNSMVMIYAYCFLKEPSEHPPIKKKEGKEDDDSPTSTDNLKKTKGYWESVFSVEIILPIIVLFVVISSFQMMGTAFAPAASDALGWGTVEISAVLGSLSFVIVLSMVVTLILTGRVHDLFLVAMGQIFWIIGGFGIYFNWERGVPAKQFVIPVVISTMGYPFIAAANRSNYSKAISSNPSLSGSAALMQSILTMSHSVAGIVTPGFVASYVVRSPDEVSMSVDHRELTPIALYVPILPFFILAGLWYAYKKDHRSIDDFSDCSDTESEDETTPLL